MPNVLRRRESLTGDAPDANEDTRLHDVDHALDEDAPGDDLVTRGPAVGQRISLQMRMGGDRIPKDDAALGAQFFKDAVDDGPGGLFPEAIAKARATVRAAPPAF